VNATTHQLVRVEPALNVGLSERAAPTIALFPNPTNDLLHVQGNVDPTSRVEVRDLLGRPCAVVSPGDLRQGIDVSALANGSYLLTLEGHPAMPFTVNR
jgi:hypothetical protein